MFQPFKNFNVNVNNSSNSSSSSIIIISNNSSNNSMNNAMPFLTMVNAGGSILASSSSAMASNSSAAQAPFVDPLRRAEQERALAQYSSQGVLDRKLVESTIKEILRPRVSRNESRAVPACCVTFR